MPVVNRIDRNNVSAIRDQIQEALNRVSLETGLSIKLGGIRFTTFSFTFKGEAIVAGTAAGNPEAVAKINWDRECRYFGLAPEDFGKTIRWHNDVQGESKSEALDPYAAVLIAHTVPADPKNTSHMAGVNQAASYVAGNKHEPHFMKPGGLESELKRSDLKLKSSHPDALKNLHANLMKVKTGESKSEELKVGKK